MEKLQIRTGQVSLEILDDNGESRGIFRFNPNDTKVAEKVFHLQDTINAKWKELESKYKDTNDAGNNLELLNETIQYFRGLVDEIFGAGTSQLLFGDSCTLSMFEDFFVGITPYYKSASEERLKKYGKKK